MGIVRTAEMQKAEIEEFRRVLLECAGVHRRKKGDEEGGDLRSIKRGEEEEDEDAQKLVCVTSGISFLGLAIVNRLLLRGYSVRIAVDNEEDLEKLRGMEMFDLMRGTDSSNNDSNQNNRVWAVMAKVTELQSLCEAFNGCRGVFHTSSFVDAAGVSGYSKYMAELEVRASKNVMEACARTESVKKCVFTSSLLACVWQNGNLDHRPLVLDHNWWSDESFCRDKKLWFALGKTMAEKAAWRVAGNRERDVKLTTICPALITGPNFFRRNPTASIAYLKGAQEMFGKGLLATTDVGRVAEAHVCVYEAMSNTAYGRYICFDRVIGREEAATELATQMGIPADRISSYNPSEFSTRFELSDGKLSRLMSAPPRCFYDSR